MRSYEQIAEDYKKEFEDQTLYQLFWRAINEISILEINHALPELESAVPMANTITTDFDRKDEFLKRLRPWLTKARETNSPSWDIISTLYPFVGERENAIYEAWNTQYCWRMRELFSL